MSVLLETSLGEIVIDLYTDKVPKTCENFLKLCKVKESADFVDKILQLCLDTQRPKGFYFINRRSYWNR